MTDNLDINSNNIIALGNPTSDTDAVTENYVDALRDEYKTTDGKLAALREEYNITDGKLTALQDEYKTRQ